MASDAFTALMDRLRDGDDEAAKIVVRRFTCQLLALARDRLDAWLSCKLDPDDLVQSVYKSFFGRLASGQCEFDSWDSLWGFLAVLAVRKCFDQRTHHRAARRDAGREQSTAIDDEKRCVLSAMSRGPTPLEAVVAVETINRLMEGLTQRDRDILSLYLHGFTMVEISLRLGRAERTVRRAVVRIRNRLQRICEQKDEEFLEDDQPSTTLSA